jgi:hypothetical protein
MADIFIAFANRDRALAETIAHELLNEGYSVFWDELVSRRRPRVVILDRIKHARVVIVLWTSTAVRSSAFLEEVKIASRANKLIQVEVPQSGFTAPLEFQQETIYSTTNRVGIRRALAARGIRPSPSSREQVYSPYIAPAVPLQAAAPVECEWQTERLQLLLRPIGRLDQMTLDGRQQNYEHLKRECGRLLETLQGNNAAPRVCALLEQYSAALTDTLDQTDIYRLGHAGIALRGGVMGAKDSLSDGNYHELAGLLTCHHLYVAQDEKWAAYVSKAQQAAITPEHVAAYADLGQNLHKQLKEFSPVIDNKIAKALGQLYEALSDASLDTSIKCYGYVKSLENVVLALVEKALEFASQHHELFSQVYLEAKNFAGDFWEETRAQLIKRGGAAVATVIVAGSCVSLASVSGYGDLAFGWLGPVKDFLEAIAKSKP